MRRFGILFIVAVLVVVSPWSAVAGCKSDCRDEYESEVDSCKLMHDDPEDADSLSSCIDSAKSQYDDCVDACDS